MGTDPEQQSGHASKNVATRVDSVCVDVSTSSSFLPKNVETIRLDHFLSAFFFGVAAVAVGVPAMLMKTRDTFPTTSSIVVLGKNWNTFHNLNIPRLPWTQRLQASALWRALTWYPLPKRGSFPIARTQIKNLERFQVRGALDREIPRQRSRFSCWHAVRLDVCLAFIVCLRSFACVCLCPFASGGPSVCVHQRLAAWACVLLCFFWAVSVRVPVSYIVCELPSLSAPCALETVVVLCQRKLTCPILSWFVLSRVVLFVCHQSACSLCCVYSSSRSPSFVCPLVIPFVLSVLCSFIRPKRLMLKLFLTRTQIKLSNSPLKDSKPQHTQSCQKNTLPELGTPRYRLG